MATSLCEKCGERPAQYICQGCGGQFCSQDVDLSLGLCKDCSSLYYRDWRGWSWILLPLSMIIILVGMILIALASLPGLSFGGVILIGPIPLVFGSGPQGFPLILIALILVLALLFLLLIHGRLRPRS